MTLQIVLIILKVIISRLEHQISKQPYIYIMKIIDWS